MSATATDTNGKYVTSVAVNNGVITITYGVQANTAITGLTLDLVPYLTPDSSVAWQCGSAAIPAGAPTPMGGTSTGGTIASPANAKYLPSACRP